MIIFKKVYKLVLVMILPFVFTANAYAQITPETTSCVSGTFCNPLGSISSFSDFVSAILKIVVSIGVPIAVLAIIFSGFLFVTAQGNEEKLKTAKSAFLWSVIGTAILLGAWAISQAIDTTIQAII